MALSPGPQKFRRTKQAATRREIQRMSPARRAAYEKGVESEEKVATALKLLIKRRTFLGYYPIGRGSEADVDQGIDFLIFATPPWCLMLQVKSSVSGKRNHYIHHGMRIPCVVVHPYVSIEDLAEQIFDVLQKATEFSTKECVFTFTIADAVGAL